MQLCKAHPLGRVNCVGRVHDREGRRGRSDAAEPPAAADGRGVRAGDPTRATGRDEARLERKVQAEVLHCVERRWAQDAGGAGGGHVHGRADERAVAKDGQVLTAPGTRDARLPNRRKVKRRNALPEAGRVPQCIWDRDGQPALAEVRAVASSRGEAASGGWELGPIRQRKGRRADTRRRRVGRVRAVVAGRIERTAAAVGGPGVSLCEAAGAALWPAGRTGGATRASSRVAELARHTVTRRGAAAAQRRRQARLQGQVAAQRRCRKGVVPDAVAVGGAGISSTGGAEGAMRGRRIAVGVRARDAQRRGTRGRVGC
jgi:hypothetical protein